MNDYKRRTEIILQRIDELAAISEDKKGITRMFGSAAFIDGQRLVFSWMKAAGLQTRIDNIGNVRGKLMSEKQGAKTFVIASHIDTVVNAGKFDGPLGVIMGLDLMEHLLQSKTKLPFHIELIAFSDEEGVRFHTTFLGSRVLAGSFDTNLLVKRDESGITLSESVLSIGGNPSLLPSDALEPDSWLGYFEIHIEQGPVLYRSRQPAAIVSAIAAQSRIEMHFTGHAGHAGTVPMDLRLDALCCAAECIIEIENFARAQKNNIVATVGKLNIVDAASNVIPGAVVCSLDIRSPDDDFLLSASAAIKETCEAVCNKRKINLQWIPVQSTQSVSCDEKLTGLLLRSFEEAGIEGGFLVSGAGHDAVAISTAAPVCMLFVRCFEGISHHPLENVEAHDITEALRISENFIHQLINNC